MEEEIKVEMTKGDKIFVEVFTWLIMRFPGIFVLCFGIYKETGFKWIAFGFAGIIMLLAGIMDEVRKERNK